MADLESDFEVLRQRERDLVRGVKLHVDGTCEDCGEDLHHDDTGYIWDGAFCSDLGATLHLSCAERRRSKITEPSFDPESSTSAVMSASPTGSDMVTEPRRAADDAVARELAPHADEIREATSRVSDAMTGSTEDALRILKDVDPERHAEITESEFAPPGRGVTYTRSSPHTADTFVNSDATDYVVRLENALYRIGTMHTDPRPDGTFNYSRAAIIEIAREALNG